jgi:hypothetical protein
MSVLRFHYLLPLILLAGAAQYGISALSTISAGSVSLWQLETDALASAGPLRYIKDVLIIGLSVAWLIALPHLRLARNLLRLIKAYFVWLALVLCVGLTGFVLGYSPLFFLPAGLRWLLLLHAAFGLFILSSSFVSEPSRHKFIFRFLLAILLVHGYVTFLQFQIASSLFDLALGAARLTGLFSNAGVAAFFVLSVALLTSWLDGVRRRERIMTSALCLTLALSSGTRFATMAVLVLILSQLREAMIDLGSRTRRILRILFVPIAAVTVFIGYQAIVGQVDRGDAISQQFSEGGRAANLVIVGNMLLGADVAELFLGRGLGVSTNTAVGALTAAGVPHDQYRFNILTDNAFLTGIFQFGLLGSIVFWYGIWKFTRIIKPRHSPLAKQRYSATIMIILLTLVAGSPFEHYFLMMAFASALGASYWYDQLIKSDVKRVRL